MLKIGDFAKLFNITIKTIRFYEEKGLIKPFYVDKYTGYRYYNDKNIEELGRILYLKSLGFSLDEISNYDENRLGEKIDDYNKTIVYLIDNEENKAERNLINIFIAQYLSQIKYEKEKKEPVFLFLDEIDKFGDIYELPRHIETARPRKLSISLITNNLNKLKNIYGDEFYSIVNAIDTQLLLGTNLKSDIEYFSDVLGLDDDFIKNDLGRDKLLIGEKGLKPIMADKNYFYLHEEWINE